MYILRYKHKQYWSICGDIDYALKPDGLEEKKKSLEVANPHMKYWVDRG